MSKTINYEGTEFKFSLHEDEIESDHYLNQIAIPILSGKRISKAASRKLETAKDVSIAKIKSMSPEEHEHIKSQLASDIAAHKLIYKSIWKNRPQLPPPAIKYITKESGDTHYKLIDEKVNGMAFFEARGFLKVYVVNTVVIDKGDADN